MGRLEVGELVILIVGRLDDGNAEDGLTVDVDLELGYVVGEDVNDNIGKSDGINHLLLIQARHQRLFQLQNHLC